MKKIGFVILLAAGIVLIGIAQVPQKFTYQAAIRNANGNAIGEQEISIKVSLRKIALDGEVVYTENHAAQTNAQGVFSISVGAGTTPTGSFAQIPWSESIYIQIEVKLQGETSFTTLGTSQILSVPYALVAEKAQNGIQGQGSAGQTVKHDGSQWIASNQVKVSDNSVEVLTKDGRDTEEPIFTVKNSDGDVVFAVYESGVRFNVDGSSDAKGSKGGFAVGGLTPAKQEIDYFVIQPDSVRFSIVESGDGKTSKGGFAVGGLTPAKFGSTNEYFSLQPSNVKFTIRDDEPKTSKGGFAVGGLTPAKQEINYFLLQSDSVRFNIIEEPDGKTSKGGFAVGGLTPAKETSDYIKINKDSTFIYTSLTATGDVNVSGNLYTGGTISSQPVTYNGYTYQTVKIGSQVWMKENLRTTQYQDGTPVNTFNDVFDYNFDPANRELYGLLYSHTAVQSASVLCPEYWHIPNQNDWETLFAFLGGEYWGENPDIITVRLMEVGMWDYATGALSPNNLSGFSARPGGYGMLPTTAGDPTFNELRNKAYFWTSGDGWGNPIIGAYIMSREEYNSLIPIEANNLTGKELYSVRCIKWDTKDDE